jgi:hypothetical protein
MKRLVYTVAFGSIFHDMAKMTHPHIKSYARRHGADFLVVDESNRLYPQHHASYEDFQIPKWLETYDEIVHLDTDLIVANDTPWLLDASAGRMCMFDESFRDAGDVSRTRVRYYLEYCHKTGKNFLGNNSMGFGNVKTVERVALKPWGRYFNIGVIGLSRRDASLFIDPEGFYDDACGYQTFMGHRIMERNHTVHDLGPEFNCMHQDWERSDFHQTAFVIHYASIRNYNWLFQQIPMDIERLKSLGRL